MHIPFFPSLHLFIRRNYISYPFANERLSKQLLAGFLTASYTCRYSESVLISSSKISYKTKYTRGSCSDNTRGWGRDEGSIGVTSLVCFLESRSGFDFSFSTLYIVGQRSSMVCDRTPD